MVDPLIERLPDEAELALAYTPPILRNALRIVLEFDARLARIVSATNEPILGQMRLAWWRDTLAMDAGKRPAGDAVLDALGREWHDQERGLVALVDGWEQLLGEPPLAQAAALAFADGRAAALAGLALLHEADEETIANLRAAGRIWAMADAVSHLSDGEERAMMLELGRAMAAPGRLPSPFRGVAVLAALGARSLAAGGQPLMAGRGAALTALRAGLLGR